jgi:two-component system response regulator YesN
MRKYKEINVKNLILKKSDDIQFIIKYIEENYNKQISVVELAQKLNLSLNYISHLFKKKTGHTIRH